MRVSAPDKFTARSETKSMGIFGAVNVGDEACWWDYGLLRLYRKNNRLLTEVQFVGEASGE